MFPLHTNKQTQPLIIVGGGLAGSLLAWSLIKKGAKTYIYMDNKPCASRVAAGLMNPVTGQRFVLAEHTPEMLTFARTFYRDIEQQLDISCFFEKPMKRLFNSQKEHENCKKRLNNAKYTGFFTHEPIPDELQAEYSGITQHQTAWLDTNTLLDALHDYFEQQKCITYTPFPEADHKPHVIYCEGHHMMSNPLFSWLPMQPAHGEIITCTSDKKLPNYIINKSKWLLPTSEHQCRIGATYETSVHTPTLQEQSKHILLEFTENIFTKPPSFEVVKHQAGIRPATLDKQPFIGFHPQHQHIAIFNGFGSRGSLLIPWYSQIFTHTLLHQQLIPKQVNIERYLSLFTPKA